MSFSDWYKKDYKEVDDSSPSIGVNSEPRGSDETQRVLFEKGMTDKGTPGRMFMRRTDGKYSYNAIQGAFEEFCHPKNKIAIDESVEDVIDDIVVVDEIEEEKE